MLGGCLVYLVVVWWLFGGCLVVVSWLFDDLVILVVLVVCRGFMWFWE